MTLGKDDEDGKKSSNSKDKGGLDFDNPNPLYLKKSLESRHAHILTAQDSPLRTKPPRIGRRGGRGNKQKVSRGVTEQFNSVPPEEWIHTTPCVRFRKHEQFFEAVDGKKQKERAIGRRLVFFDETPGLDCSAPTPSGNERWPDTPSQASLDASASTLGSGEGGDGTPPLTREKGCWPDTPSGTASYASISELECLRLDVKEYRQVYLEHLDRLGQEVSCLKKDLKKCMRKKPHFFKKERNPYVVTDYMSHRYRQLLKKHRNGDYDLSDLCALIKLEALVEKFKNDPIYTIQEFDGGNVLPRPHWR